MESILSGLLSHEGPNPLAKEWLSYGEHNSKFDSMDAEQQQGRLYQRMLWEHESPPEDSAERPRPGDGSDGSTEASPFGELQTSTATGRERALTTTYLMEEVTHRRNLWLARERVVSNKGAPGVDGLTVLELESWLDEHQDALIASLLDGSFEPALVRGKQIPKPQGGIRQLGIPTVVDRFVQQAIMQVLERLLDPTFSDSSYGFRRGRSAHDALQQASEYVAAGRTTVVDMDLEKFFDRVNHDILMSRLARRVEDKRLLRIIRRFLEAGMMQDGVCIPRDEGAPQGGPLSPLLANLLLDDLDKELERRGHCFCRYADDCNIYVRSQAAGERVLASITKFLEEKLKLQVNQKKSAVANVWERKFLGHRLRSDGSLQIAPSSLVRAKDRIRDITRRNRGDSFDRVIGELNSFLMGWVAYYRYTSRSTSSLRHLDSWIRRKLRCYRLKQRKRAKSISEFLRSLGVPKNRSWTTAASGKGWWRMSGTPAANEAMSNTWFAAQGLVASQHRYVQLQT